MSTREETIGRIIGDAIGDILWRGVIWLLWTLAVGVAWHLVAVDAFHAPRLSGMQVLALVFLVSFVGSRFHPDKEHDA